MKRGLNITYTCSVCGQKHKGKHFGVQACRACASFYRRSLVEGKVYKCRGTGNCQLSKELRNDCRACRLERCKRIGMTESRIRYLEYDEERPECSKEHSKTTGAAKPTTDLIKQYLNPANCPTNELEKFVAHYRNFCNAERSMYITENPEDLFSTFETVKFKPITRSEQIRMERGTVPLVHRLLLDTAPIYRELSHDNKVKLMKIFLYEFICLHRAFVSARVYREDKPRVILNYGYYWDVESALGFFEGSKKPEENAKFMIPIIESFLVTVRKMREVNLTEPELMKTVVLNFYNILHDLGLDTPETRKAADDIHTEFLFYLASQYGVPNIGPRIGYFQRLMQHIVKQASEFRESMVIARIFFPDAGTEVWDNLDIHDGLYRP